ncbi:hypothetical protein WICPIJ_008660 [Wickerhamomyces pijperi]|uniref:FMP27 GFWDK domain-containing protein n=1 Tax=Wickerhamomyces pijperi TaxID=599730 RepID=A0A9P8PX74_WICPI|nr:hypothetical protein WICPIJ_008660 [Wickerhamomyces pijperi]
MILLDTIPTIFNAVRYYLFNYFVFRVLLLMICASGVLHILLILFFGLSIKFVNPFRMEVLGIGFRNKDVIVKIQSVRFILSLIGMLTFTVLVDGIELTIRDKKDTGTSKEHHDSVLNERKAAELRQSILDINDRKLCIFPKNPLVKYVIKLYLLYLRFVTVKFLNVKVTHEKSGIELTTELSNNKVKLSTLENITKFELSVRAFQQGVNSVDLFQAFSIQVAGILDMSCGDLSKVQVSVDLIGANVPVYTLVKAISPLKERKQERKQEEADDDGVAEFTEYDYLIKMYNKMVFGTYFVKLIEKISVSMHNVSVSEIPLATKDLALCHKFEPKTFIEVNVGSVNLGCNRMHFDYPGYGLLYSYDDKPYHFVYNFTGISLSLNNRVTNSVKEVMNVPVMNFTGHSNLAFQNLETSKTFEYTNSKINVIGHMAEPIIDLSTDEIITTLQSAFDFLRYQHFVRSNPSYIKKQEHLAEMKKKNKSVREKMDMKFQKFWPVFSVKMGIENPTVMIKDNFDDKYSRILVLQHSMVSAEVTSRREVNGDVVQYFTEEKFDAHHASVKFRDTSTCLERSVVKVDHLHLRQRFDILPQKNLQSAVIVKEPKIDLSNIVILNGINFMFSQLEAKVTDVFHNFMHHTLEFDCYCTKSCTNPYTEQMKLRRQQELDAKSVVEIINGTIPDWIHKLKVTTNNFKCVVGSRSLFLPKEVMKSLDPQTKCDFIDGKLRKIELCSDEATVEFLDQSSAGADSDIIPSAVPSTIEEDEDIGLSDSTSEVSSEVSIWKFRFTIKKLVGRAITETTKEKDKLTDKIFLKVPKLTLDLRPSSNDEDKILLDCDADRMELVYSIITHFLIASSFHLLRNTIFEALWKKMSAAKKRKKEQEKKTPQTEDSTMATKPSMMKRIIASIELGLNINFLDLILVMPNKLKSRFEITNINVFGILNNPLILNSDFIRICVESQTTPGYWSRFATATEGATTIDIPKIIEKGPGSWIDFTHNVCHITMPNKLMMYQVFNNISLLVKTIKQLHYSLKHNTNEFILYPKVKRANKLPAMNLKSNRLILSLEDDPFEAELNMILQIGILEQRDRATKMKIFDRELSERLTTAKATSAKSQTFQSSSTTVSGADSKSGKKECKIPTPDFSLLSSKIKTINHTITDTFQVDKSANQAQSLSNIPTKAGESLKPHFQKAFDIQQDAQEKLYKLRESFSKSWIRRVQNFRAKAANETRESFEYLWGAAYHLERLDGFNKKVLEFSDNPLLFTLILEGVDLDIGQPSFGIENISDYIHDVGKGVPKTTQYSTLVPLMLDLKLSELRLHLRDYPLPMIHMPAITKNQPRGLPAVRIHGDLVIAEAMIQSKHEIREMFVRLSPGCGEFDEDNSYSIEIPKTLTPIKFFTSLNWDVNSELASRVTWGNSYQPCISQIMASLDNFTKPPIDPSVKTGFWDKIRLNFHARIRFNFNYNGDFHIVFKGSKNPYDITGGSSGFILGFKNNVVLTCNDKENTKEFITANSDEIIFSVPNHFAEPLLVWCRPTHQAVFLTDPTANYHRSTFGFYFGSHELADPAKVESMKRSYIQKHVISLRGGTQLNFSVLFERNRLDNPQKRTTESRPHYDIVLCNPKYVDDLDSYDAYRGFRSEYIHLEFQLVSTQNEAYNTIQLSPMALQFFFKWWKMFSNSLPIRQGKLFGPDRHSQKFSHYLSTLKYQAIIEPLFMTHIHHDGEIAVSDHQSVECVGLKGRASRLVLDLHQRKELVFDHNETLDITRKTMKNKFNLGMIEILDFDVRAIKALFKSSTPFQDFSNSRYNPEKVDFKTYDNDLNWLDLTDFNEIGIGSLHDFKAKVYAHALMKTPRFIYIKKNAYGDKYQVDAQTGERIDPFGNESYHDCLYHLSQSSIDTIVHSFNTRIEELELKVQQNKKELDSFAGKTLGLIDKQKIQQLRFDTDQIVNAIVFVKELSAAYSTKNACETVKDLDFEFVVGDAIEDTSFTNSFVIHNMLLKWNDNTRNIFYRYIYLIERLSNLNQFLLSKSLGEIDEAIEAQHYGKDHTNPLGLARTVTGASVNTAERVQTQFTVETEDSRASQRLKNFKDELHELGVNFFYKTHDDYRIKFVTPQIQLQSEENKNSSIVVAAPAIEMNIIGFDSNENEESDPDVFEKRFGITFSDASIFMFQKNEIFNTGKLFFSSTSYGSNSSWPPWLGVELCYDSHLIEDHVLLNKTTFVARYDKIVNTSFLGSQRNQANKLSVDLSQALFLCDSKQYYALYSIVLNLLIYNDTKIRAIKEREAKLLLKLDNKDLSNVKDRVVELQRAVKEADTLLDSMTSRRAILDDVEHTDMYLVNDAIFEATTELYLLMRVSLLGSVDTTREKVENYMEWNIRADDIKLHMLDESRHPFVDVILFNSHFKRMERSDRSDRNTITIDNIEILNLDQNSNLPVLFSALAIEKKATEKKKKIVREADKQPLVHVSWHMENPVAGIRLMKKFDVELLPLQISIEESTGAKLMEFAFPNASPLIANYDSDELIDDDLDHLESEDNDISEDDEEVESRNHRRFPESNVARTTGLTPIEEQAIEVSDDETANGHFHKFKFGKPNGHLKSNGSSKASSLIDGRLSHDDGPAHKRSFSLKALSRSGSFQGKNAKESQRNSAYNRSVNESEEKIQWAKITALDENAEDEGVDLMLERASTYISIVSFALRSSDISITFRGTGAKRLINVCDFVIHLPEITLFNRTCTLLDIVNELKKNVIKALLAHSGSLIGNKLSKRDTEKHLANISGYSSARIHTFRGDKFGKTISKFNANYIEEYKKKGKFEELD